jgi:hypothetical protein
MHNESIRRATIKWDFLLKWSKKIPNLSQLSLTLILEDDLPKILEIAWWGVGEIPWKSFLNLEDNDKVNDLIQTSKDLFNIYEVEMGIRIQPSTVYQKREEMLLGLEKYHINQIIHFWWSVKFLI